MHTFEITIQRKSGSTWPVVVEYSRTGELPIRREGLLQFADNWRADLTSHQLDPRAYGTLLGESLFRESIRDLFVQARKEGDGNLRVLLVVEALELKDLNWERLSVPVRLGGQWDHLALDQQTLFSLYLPSLTDRRFPAIGRRDLRALVLVANAPEDNQYGLAPFDAQVTVDSVTSALDDIPNDVLATVQGAVGLPTLNELCTRITAQPYTLLHIVAHGWLRRDDGETILYLLDDAGEIAPVTTTHLLERLDQLQGVRGLPQLTFLATCESAAPEAEREGALGGLAQRLVRELGMPAVLAMTERVSIATAQAFAAAFYTRLREQGEADRALVEACAGLSDRGDVTVPALYSRLGGRPLFSDTMDRPLTSAEIHYGLTRMKDLLSERAPVLQPEFEKLAKTIRGTLGIAPKALVETALDERTDAMREVNNLCREVMELNFNALSLGQKPPLYDEQCPFLGLNHFGTDDRPFFFGREALVQELVEKLDENPFLAIVGPSGSGKSSLVLAGVVPATQEQNPLLQLRYLTPGSDPMAQLTQTLGDSSTNTDPHSVLVVDQFEELFTLCSDEKKRQDFLDQLLSLTQSMRVVITMRADFWGDCAPYPNLKKIMQAHQELIAPMTIAELRSAMEQQARAVGLRFEADLSQSILDDVQGEPGTMPLLQHALRELWNRRHGRWLRGMEYRALGGVQQAIGRTADEIYRALSVEERERMRDIFVRLTRLDEEAVSGEERRDTRRRVQFTELVPNGRDAAPTRRLVQELADARLLVTSVNKVTEVEEVEVAHEALIRYWKRLRDWVDETPDMFRLRQKIGQDAHEWAEGARQDALLPRWNTQLEEAVVLARQPRFVLSKLERDYLDACVGLRDREAEEQLRSTNRLRRLVGALAVVSLLAIVAAFYAQRQQQFATNSLATAVVAQATSTKSLAISQARGTEVADERNRAEEQLAISQSRQIAAVARNRVAASDPEQGLLLSAVALDQKIKTAESQRAMREALEAWRGIRAFKGHTDVVSGIVFSPDERLLATISDDDTARIWTIAPPMGDSPAPIILMHNDDVTGALFSADGQFLVTSSRDDVARIWRVSDGTLQKELPHEQDIRSLGMHPNGQWFATRSGDEIALWDIVTGDPVAHSPYKADGAALRILAFTADGSNIIAGSDDTKVWLWHIESGQNAQLVRHGNGHQSAVVSVAQSLDKKFIASMSTGAIIVWTWVDGQGFVDVKLPQSSDGQFFGQLAFSSDSRFLAIGSENGIVRVWNMGKPNAEPFIISELTGRISGIKFNPNGQSLVVASYDGAVRLWNLEARTSNLLYRTRAGNVFAPVFNRDGTIFATSDSEGTVRLWRVWLGGNIGYYPLHVALGHGIEVSSDKLVAVGEDGTVERWDLQSGQAAASSISDTRLTATAANLSNEQLAIGDAQGHLYLYDVQSEEVVSNWRGHSAKVNSMILLAEQKLLITASDDAAIKGWDYATNELIMDFEGHIGGVTGLALSQDREIFWSSGADGTIRRWLLSQNKEVETLYKSNAPLINLALSQDDAYIAAGDLAGQIHILKLSELVESFLLPLDTNARSLVFDATNRLITGNENGEISLWNLAMKESVTFQAHSDKAISGLVVDSNNHILYSMGHDGLIRTWLLGDENLLRLACQRSQRSLTEAEWGDLFTFSAPLTVCQNRATTTENSLESPRPLVDDSYVSTSNQPQIYYFDSITGPTVPRGEKVKLRWSTDNATKVMLSSMLGNKNVASPSEQEITVETDTTFWLIAENEHGKRKARLRIVVEEVRD